MSEPTPSRYRRELKTWSKNDLVREVERLRALTREHARRPGEDTTGLPGSIVDVVGDPHAHGGALVDARNAILLDEVDVCLVDPNPGEPEEHGRVALTLAGRVNMRDERSTVLLMFDADGAAAVVTQLIGLAVRAGDPYAAEFAGLVEARTRDLP